MSRSSLSPQTITSAFSYVIKYIGLDELKLSPPEGFGAGWPIKE